MKRIIFILFSLVLFASCTQKPKTYTLIIHGNRDVADEKSAIEALNDSVAYRDALVKFYGAKIASKQYKF